ncbi:2Fe-2S iron-sulfur cluster-binding protein [Flammeovirga pacifica]|nr:2Fe-2S iron-sulfur cluster-binding protein [Flammeovirga pacifica]
MKISIDGILYDKHDRDKTLLDVIKRNKLSVTAPCYKTMRKYGTCNSCLIEVEGEVKLSCGIPPEEGMNYVLKRDDLLEERKNKVKEFKTHFDRMKKLFGE